MAFNRFFHEYPYTDFHELNLDWVLKKLYEFEQRLDNLKNEIMDELRAEIKVELDKLKAELAAFKDYINKWITEQNKKLNDLIAQVNNLIEIVNNRIALLEANFEAFKMEITDTLDKRLKDLYDKIIKELSENITKYIVHNYLTGYWVTIQEMFDFLCKLHILYPMTNNDAIATGYTRDEAGAIAGDRDITNLIIYGGQVFNI